MQQNRSLFGPLLLIAAAPLIWKRSERLPRWRGIGGLGIARRERHFIVVAHGAEGLIEIQRLDQVHVEAGLA